MHPVAPLLLAVLPAGGFPPAAPPCAGRPPAPSFAAPMFAAPPAVAGGLPVESTDLGVRADPLAGYADLLPAAYPAGVPAGEAGVARDLLRRRRAVDLLGPAAFPPAGPAYRPEPALAPPPRPYADPSLTRPPVNLTSAATRRLGRPGAGQTVFIPRGAVRPGP